MQTCFVIMPFGTLFDKYYERVYSPAIMDAGLEPQRADEIFTPGPFMRDVVLGIMKSSMILAELTGRNANVFYELGLCHALEKTAVLIAQSEADIPSDLRALKFLTYNTADPDWANYLKSSVTNTLRSADNEESSRPRKARCGSLGNEHYRALSDPIRQRRSAIIKLERPHDEKPTTQEESSNSAQVKTVAC